MGLLPPPPGFPPSELPPPPAGPNGSPVPPGTESRPGFVTAAGVILIVLGVLGVLAGLILIVFRGAAGIEDLRLGGDLVWVGIVAIVFAGIEIAAGALVLRRSGAGRLLGIVAAGIGVLGAIGSVASAEMTGLVALVLNGLVLYGLIAYGRAFRREGGGYTRDGRRGAAR